MSLPRFLVVLPMSRTPLSDPNKFFRILVAFFHLSLDIRRAHTPCSSRAARRVLNTLAKHMPFEIAAGLNGAFWVDSGKYEKIGRGGESPVF